MKKVIILVLCCFVLCSCNEKNVVEKLIVEKVNCVKMLDLLEEGAVLVDVRTEVEFNAEHLDNAVNVPIENLLEGITKVVDNKDTKIVLYCRSGNRSANAGQQLVDAGYTNVFDLGAITNCTG